MKRVFSIPQRTHGNGPVFFTWQVARGNYLVTTGYDHIVNVYDRHGERKDQVSLPGMCVGMAWDKDGDMLGLINERSPVLILWDSNSQRITQVDTGLRDVVSLLLWSPTAPLLAVATTKGNLLIYNHRTSRKVPILGKHGKRISFGAWSKQNYLALVGEDRMLTISNQDGDTVCQTSVRADPSLVQFVCVKTDDKDTADNTVSVVLNKKSLFMMNIHDSENPVMLAFQERYGNIVDYKWYDENYILLGFSNGYLIVITAQLKDVGQELHQIKCHKGALAHIATCVQHSKVATCGDNTLKVYNLKDLEDVQSVVTVDDERELEWMEWTDDGQLLAVGGAGGGVHIYLTKLPVLGDSYGTQMAYLTSLLEVTVANLMEQESVTTFRVDIEPSFLALGPYHLAVGMNNRVWFYVLNGKGSGVPLRDREYLGSVQSLKMNGDYASALFEGKLQLHLIDGDYGESEERESRLFPDGDFLNLRITCQALTTDYLIYGTNNGSIQFFLLEDWQSVNDFRHSCEITYLQPDPTGTRLFFIDSRNEAYIYNPVNDQLTQVADFPMSITGALWDMWPLDKGGIVAFDSTQIYSYIYARDTIQGPSVELVGTTKLPSGQHPILLYNGELTCQTQSGKTAQLHLTSHPVSEKEYSSVELKDNLKVMLKLLRFRESWTICQQLNSKEDWELLANTAMSSFDVEQAIRVYQHLGDVGMVWSLDSLKDIEDRNLLGGHLNMIKGEFDKAQDLYLMSSRPLSALEMRRDLLHWDQALQLAKKLAPDQIAYISREYAQQLEFMGDYVNALLHYEKGQTEDGKNTEQNMACMAGIARTSIKCGDIRKGVQLAQQIDNRTLKRECAEILEGMKQYGEAAALYETSSYFDKAAALFIKLKNWKKVGALLEHITSPKLHSQYGKAKEAEGDYREAIKAYQAARDHLSVIRLHLDHLNNPEEAVKLVKENKSVEGAKMVARFFQRLNDMTSAIQFLVMSKCNEEAFQLAQSNNKMELYADVIGEDASLQDYLSIATFYENEKNHPKAGRFFYLAGQHKKAVKYLLRSDDSQSMQLVIQAVGAAADEQLTRQVIEYLMGETDGVPKDFKYLFRLYMSLKQYREAAKTALIIAREEQNAGNYRNAHDVLFSMYRELGKQNIKIPAEMATNLMILHSYILVKLHVRRGDHTKGARMLIRVANNISKFPSHIVPILTSTVIECHRAGLKKSSFSYATMLMRPEYRSQIDLKYKKKIEAIIRKPQKLEESEESGPCPYCDTPLPDSDLSCMECQNNIPFCIVTGRHIVKEGITECPNCNFPAFYTEFSKLLETESNCPMCSEKVTDLPQRVNVRPHLYPEGE